MDLENKVDLLSEAVAQLHSRIDKLIVKQNFAPETVANNPATINDYVSHEYFVLIRFRLKKGVEKQLYACFEEYLTAYPFAGLKTCGVYDMENDAGEYAIMEYFDTAENYLKALDRADNSFLDSIRKLVVPDKDGDYFIGSHGRLLKSFDHLMIK